MRFRITAGTNVGLRDNNEDNFVVSPDLTAGQWTLPGSDTQFVDLGQMGAVMAVADGMGGQNAGEVASAIAIETVQQEFMSDAINEDLVSSPRLIKNYLRRTIIEADKRIKQQTLVDPSTSNMGSTLVIAWFVNDKVYIGWIGDSRAYSIIPGKGIGRLSKDHSYVQQLIDSGKITEKQALTHPDNNIITRSLGDTSKVANPDVIEHPLTKGECILLCSDGLCGYVEDAVIGEKVESNMADLQTCKSVLMTTALNHGSSDNITVALCVVDYLNGGSESIEPKKTKSMSRLVYGALGIILITSLIVIFNQNRKATPIVQDQLVDSPKIKTKVIPTVKVVEIEEPKNSGDNTIDKLDGTAGNEIDLRNLNFQEKRDSDQGDDNLRIGGPIQKKDSNP